jgi:hypothetical protein
VRGGVEHQQQVLPVPARQQVRQQPAPERGDRDPLVAQPAAQALLAAGGGDGQRQRGGHGPQADPAAHTVPRTKRASGRTWVTRTSGSRAVIWAVRSCNNRARGDIGGLLAIRIGSSPSSLANPLGAALLQNCRAERGSGRPRDPATPGARGRAPGVPARHSAARRRILTPARAPCDRPEAGRPQARCAPPRAARSRRRAPPVPLWSGSTGSTVVARRVPRPRTGPRLGRGPGGEPASRARGIFPLGGDPPGLGRRCLSPAPAA